MAMENDTFMSNINFGGTRTSAGKKIDSWRVSLPDGGAAIDIFMMSDRDGCTFEARSTHPALKGYNWSDSDLEELRETVTQGVEKASKLYFSRDWEPALVVEAEMIKLDMRASKSVRVELSLTQVATMRENMVGNRGETPVIENGGKLTIIQKSYNQKFEHVRKGAEALQKDNFRLAQEDRQPTTRVVMPQSDESALTELQDALESFGIHLMKRMAPDVMRLDGVPGKEELVDIMKQAIESQEAYENPNEFKS